MEEIIVFRKTKYLISKLLKKTLNIPAIKNCEIDVTSRVCSASDVTNSTMGRYSYIGSYCSVINTNIGSFCSIADHCVIGGAAHSLDWVSTSPVFNSGKNIMHKNFSESNFEPFKNTVICNDVWIGSNSLIKSGVRIGNGAVVGMGSVVTKDVEPYTIVAGNPAKVIRKRFDSVTIEKLNKINWWNWENDKISEMATYFNNIDLFLKKS